MNRTERLYAIVEELRAVSPRPRTASWLAQRFEVTTRTIERDLEGLRESGLPIRGGVGRSGGYFLDRDRTLGPITLTTAEALAVGIALRTATGTPFSTSARTAELKIRAVLPDEVRRREEVLSSRVHRVGGEVGELSDAVAAAVERAVVDGLVLHLVYRDGRGERTERDVEPMGLLSGRTGWYLMGWCRLRDGVRGFDLSRIERAEVTGERAPDRTPAADDELERLQAVGLRATDDRNR